MMKYVLVAAALALSPVGGQQTASQAAVMKADEAYRVAKLKNDIPAISRLLAADFYEMNQNGNGRNKAEATALWKAFRITSLKTDHADVSITGSTAIVRGEQTEENGTGIDRMLFMRTYTRVGANWKLLASMQFRNPR
jgi:hypothetical protein